ncbi:MAG TPA: molecular chaperone DnaJ [Cyanobacteria bacterium UBA12227]|nr:molecular chaperone DnaJ [Cyanobacteria bacterium UBA12227]HAX84915.1 molecular chaperone DnaJ [Cyanobacteria bacterium UBA11370]HBY79432.1 molecular chaperone DnaJ [Cyanobacteria bacterium UBA11148]
MQDSRNYYQILEVSKEATSQEIKKAYRRLARQYHPDLHPENPAATERFKEICQAYQILSNPLQRREYDQQFESKRSQAKTTRMTAQDFYQRAVSKAQSKDYQGAIADCNRAIELNPHLVEAYIERGASRYKLGNAREALQDCNQALSLNSNCTKAYYYQGRARYRLGYTQAAIEAYTMAIAQSPTFAKAYYHRGLAYKDLEDSDRAILDLENAAKLFSTQGDKTGYQLVQEALKIIHQTQGKQKAQSRINHLNAIKDTLGNTIKTFQSFALNPAGGLLPAFASLSKRQAGIVGIVFAVIFDSCLICGIYLGWRDLFELSFFKLSIIGIVPFITLVMSSAIARLILRRSGSFAGDSFIAGTSLMPLSFLMLLSGISLSLGSNIMIILTVFATSYTILTLYNGCTQIANLSETSAALLTPLILLVSGWFSYWVFTAML